MRVWLVKCRYDDGAIYESTGYTYICRIVDSEEKAKNEICERAKMKCEDDIKTFENRMKGETYLDEDGVLLYKPWSEEKIKIYLDRIGFLKRQIAGFSPKATRITVRDAINEHESWLYYYESWNVN